MEEIEIFKFLNFKKNDQDNSLRYFGRIILKEKMKIKNISKIVDLFNQLLC